MKTSKSAPQVVMISLEVWDHVWRRNQFVSRELALAGYDVDFVGPPRDYSNAFRTGNFASLKSGNANPLAGVRVSRPTKLLPNSVAIGRKINQTLATRHVLNLIMPGSESPVLWINDQSMRHLAVTIPYSALIYDITDDWCVFEQSPIAKKWAIADDEWLCRHSEAVIVCSEQLYERKLKLVPEEKLFLIANGVDVDHYANCHKDASSSEGPCFGYTGSIHGQRLDVNLLADTAKQLSAGEIVLVGPDMLTTEERDRLLSSGRIRITGSVPYEEIPAVMRQMDVMIVPHKVTSFTESLNPIKLWEYMASGKPVVSTPVAGFRDYPQLVSLAASPQEFYTAMTNSLDEPVECSKARKEMVLNHTWKKRACEIEKVIQKVVSGKRDH